MYKLNYDENGKIIGFYSDKIQYKNIPQNCIEISDELYSKIVNNTDKIKIIDKKIVDISDTQEYEQEKKQKFINQQTTLLKIQIEKIEASQHRCIRENILNPNEESIKRLENIENQISTLRSQLTSLSD